MHKRARLTFLTVDGYARSVKTTTSMEGSSATDAKRSRPSLISMASPNIYSRRTTLHSSNKSLCQLVPVIA